MVSEASGALNAYRAAVNRLQETPGNSDAGKSNPSDFSTMVKGFADDAVNAQKTAESATISAAAGQTDLNSVVLAVAEAEITLKSVVTMRDKVVQAYQQIVKMPI
ncbi:MAG: flagellar hook-basal body complex protein FliE [Rhodospirillales bacterium]|nr:flagellar hook-basal body complex protein FliE [Rhodospirillales bacterium]